jgi:hypothetical protein
VGADCPSADGCCPPDGCCPDGPCGLRGRLARGWACDEGRCPTGRIWLSGEYLLWSIKDGSSPPLVTASPPGTARTSAGVLGAGSAVLFGGEDNLDYNQFSGGRFTLGFCLPGWDMGFESTYFFLGRRNINFFALSAGAPMILGRPINNVNTGLEAAQLVAFPDVVAGSVAVHSSSRLWGVEGNFRKRLLCGCNSWVDGLLGFRYLQFDERLNITEDLTPLEPALFTRLLVVDSFSTRNQFYGGQLGLEGECRWKHWILGGQFKLGLGVMHQVVDVNGASVFFQPGGLPPDLRQGGLLALRSNIGRQDSNVFAVVPEVGVKLGYQLTDNLRIYAGYSFLYVSDVVRPGDQIDRGINRSQQPDVGQDRALVGAARPIPMFRHTDFWAHGANFGLELKY